MRVQTTAVISFISGMSMSASAAPRDIQFINIHPESEVLQLFNSSDEPISIEGWRFCSHNTSEVRRYTSPSTFDGVVIPAQTSFTIHLDDDAGFNEPLEFNASSLGLFAGFELDAYSISLYFPTHREAPRLVTVTSLRTISNGVLTGSTTPPPTSGPMKQKQAAYGWISQNGSMSVTTLS